MTTDQRLSQQPEAEIPVTHVGLIEWGSADCREPTILLATTRHGVAVDAVKELEAAWCECCGDDPQFLAEHPILADWDEAQVLAWLDALREGRPSCGTHVEPPVRFEA